MAENVVELGDYRFTHKRRHRYPKPECEHKRFELDDNGDIVMCLDCGKQVSAYYALRMLTEHWGDVQSKIAAKQARADGAHGKAIHLLAARKVEEAWRSRTMVPARVRFLSMEPLLGPVSLTTTGRIPADDEGPERIGYMVGPDDGKSGLWPTPSEALRRSGIHWVIVGGESGPGARPMHPDWARSLCDQCEAVGTPFLFKQWGEWKPIGQMKEHEHERLYRSNVTAKPHENQDNLDDCYGRSCTVPYTVVHLDGSVHGITEPMAFLHGTGAMQTFKLGKKSAGRILDGRTWDGFPAP